MQKNYCPIRIKNPNSKNSLVRLLAGQKMHIIFNDKSFQDYKLDLTGSFLSVEEVTEVPDGWMVSVSQKTEIIKYFESTLYLGGVNLFDGKNQHKASLCVVSNNENNDYLRVIEPRNITCNITPDQVLDVVFYGNMNERWTAYPSGKDICVEMLQHYIRSNKNICPEGSSEKPLIEHFFRFRFDRKSINYLSDLPYAKHDGGHILFVNSNNERSILKITCSWRGKNSIYKALLLPRIPFANNNIIGKKQAKQCLRSSIMIEKIESNVLESGCNVLLAKVSEK
jgi:hypothetical protein